MLGEGLQRGPALSPIPVMRAPLVVEAQEAVQVRLQRLDRLAPMIPMSTISGR